MLFKQKQSLAYFATMVALAIGLASCGSEMTVETSNEEVAVGSKGLEGTIEIDGSSTVFPITEAVAEEFQTQYPGVRVIVSISGTGGGFKKFCHGETAISDASRPIKASEIAACEEAGISFIELPVAYDAIALVANPDNNWAECLSVEELQKIWTPEAQGTIDNWNQVRAKFPDQPLSLYGPGTDSGTFDYFTDALVGEEGASRGDYTASEDDNVIIQGVANDLGGLGYFGLAYLEENQDILKAIKVDNQDPDDGEGCISPAVETVDNGTYQPLARPIFIYVSTEVAKRLEVQEFVQFYLNPTNAESLVSEVGYVPLSTDLYKRILSRFEKRTTGSIFGGGSTVGVNLKEEYSK